MGFRPIFSQCSTTSLVMKLMKAPNQSLVRTQTTLRFVCAAQLQRWAAQAEP